MRKIETSSIVLDEFLKLKKVPTKLEIGKILELPRENLIIDLENLLLSIIDNPSIDEEEHILIAIHPVFLLSELKSIESFPLYLKLYEQNDKFLYYYFEEHLTKTMWRDIHCFGLDKINELFDFLKSNGIQSLGSNIVISSLINIAVTYSDFTNKIVDSFRDLYNYIYVNAPDCELKTKDLINIMLISGIGENHILSVAKPFYEANRATEYGSWEGFVEYNDSIQGSYTLNPYSDSLTLEERYNDISTIFILKDIEGIAGYMLKEEGLIEESFDQPNIFYNDYSPYVKVTPTIGRNESCPCGSGKKYKKCCEK